MAKMTAEQRYEKKKRDVNIGLANNAFGAAAGGIATGAAFGGAKKLYERSKVDQANPEHIYHAKTKPLPNWKVLPSKIRGRSFNVGAGLKKIPGPAKVGAAVAGAGLVGMQAVNAGMDAQSAAYFARERAGMKKPVQKSYWDAPKEQRLTAMSGSSPRRGMGLGMSLNAMTPVVKKDTPRGEEREQDRIRRLERNRILGYGGSAAAGTAGAHILAQRYGGWGNLGTKAVEGAFDTKRPPVGSLIGRKVYRPSGKFAAGAALLGAAPAGIMATRRMQEHGKQEWR